jgi:hypothetical protein
MKGEIFCLAHNLRGELELLVNLRWIPPKAHIFWMTKVLPLRDGQELR